MNPLPLLCLLCQDPAPTGTAPAPRALDSQQPVATVNGRPIPAARVYSMYQMNKTMLQQRGRELNATDDQALKAESLEFVVADELLYQASIAKGIKAPPPHRPPRRRRPAPRRHRPPGTRSQRP